MVTFGYEVGLLGWMAAILFWVVVFGWVGYMIFIVSNR